MCNPPSLRDNSGIVAGLKFSVTRRYWKGARVEKMVKVALNNVGVTSYFKRF